MEFGNPQSVLPGIPQSTSFPLWKRERKRTEESVWVLRGYLVVCLKIFSFKDTGYSNHRTDMTAWLGLPEAGVWMGHGPGLAPKHRPSLEQPLSSCVSECLLQVTQAVGRCVLCRVCLCLCVIWGCLGESQTSWLTDSGTKHFQKTSLKLAKLLGYPATSLPGSLTMTQASGLMLQ